MLKGANKSLKNTPKGASNSIAYALGSRYSLFSVDCFLTTFYEKWLWIELFSFWKELRWEHLFIDLGIVIFN